MWFATFSGETVEKASERVGISLGKMILQDVNYHHYGTLVLIILVMGRKLFFQSWLDWSFTGDQNLMKKTQNGQLEMLPPYYRETVQLCFSTSA
jgi:hypothetical protein